MEELSLPEVHPLPPEGTAEGRTGPSRAGQLDGGKWHIGQITYKSIYQGVPHSTPAQKASLNTDAPA